MSDISKSRITTDAEFEKRVAGADFETIKVLMADRAVQLGLVQRDIYDPSVLVPTAPGTAPQKFAKTIEVGGVKRIFEGNSELEVERAANAFLKQTFQGVVSGTGPELARDNRGRFTTDQGPADDDVFAKAELELRFKRGEISTADYLTATGAIERHLYEQGVDMDALREASGQNLQAKWGKCVEEFLNADAGGDWPGGPKNLQAIQDCLVTMHAEREPSVDNIAIAYKWLKDNNKLVKNESVEAARRISEAKSPAELRAVLDASRGSSSLFGR